ncbi:hypothetical protein [Listeria kieliensis]|uniref:hypothetical protein n=1 Tax=Listeria kieliensis TaxID=1621700 RepID=UPI003B831ADF
MQAFAILWDNQAMSGGKLKTYYPDHQLSYYKRSDGMYSLYYPNEKKWYYTTTYWLQPR